MKKIFLTRSIPQAGLDILRDHNCSITISGEKKPLSQDDLIAQCKQHDVLLSVGGPQLDARFFTECAHLKGIALMSVGYDNVDMKAATIAGIPVSNTPGVLSRATADIALLLILAVSRKAFFMHNSIAKGQWGVFDPADKLGIELYDKTLGIFGLGRIGMELAQKCQSVFQMKIIYHNRSRNAEAEKQFNARYVPFAELLQESDVISVHASLSAETKEIFNTAAFSKMKNSAIFINTARGSLHNETDLISALEAKTIWGAGLDVTNPEPMLPGNPLLFMQNACVVPHIGSATVETRNKMAVMVATNALAAANGNRMPQVINKDVYH